MLSKVFLRAKQGFRPTALRLAQPSYNHRVVFRNYSTPDVIQSFTGKMVCNLTSYFARISQKPDRVRIVMKPANNPNGHRDILCHEKEKDGDINLFINRHLQEYKRVPESIQMKMKRGGNLQTFTPDQDLSEIEDFDDMAPITIVYKTANNQILQPEVRGDLTAKETRISSLPEPRSFENFDGIGDNQSFYKGCIRSFKTHKVQNDLTAAEDKVKCLKISSEVSMGAQESCYIDLQQEMNMEDWDDWVNQTLIDLDEKSKMKALWAIRAKKKTETTFTNLTMKNNEGGCSTWVYTKAEMRIVPNHKEKTATYSMAKFGKEFTVKGEMTVGQDADLKRYFEATANAEMAEKIESDVEKQGWGEMFQTFLYGESVNKA